MCQSDTDVPKPLVLLLSLKDWGFHFVAKVLHGQPFFPNPIFITLRVEFRDILLKKWYSPVSNRRPGPFIDFGKLVLRSFLIRYRPFIDFRKMVPRVSYSIEAFY